ncbi:pyrroline-5-carboxylate reductase [Thermaurantiacus sp.]
MASRPSESAARLARIWVVGCGQMAGALVARWQANGLAKKSLLAIDPAPRALPEGVALVPTLADAAARLPEPTLLVLGVKPQNIAEVGRAFAALGPAGGRPLLLSMLAGVRVQTLASLFHELPVARIMPNLPARVGAGVTALYAPALAPSDRAAIDWLLAAAGETVTLEEEGRFDAVTALSGSGPAFLYRFIEALAGAGEAAGLDSDLAQTLARRTIEGAAALLAASADTPAELRQKVTSPHGTTEAGLDVLDGDGALSALMRATVRAAAERARALAAAAETDVAEARSARDVVRA